MGTLNRQNTLSKQTSNVFNMTLDELQLSMGSGKAFGSMNMVCCALLARYTDRESFRSNRSPWLTWPLQDELLQTVWTQDPQLLNTVSTAEPDLGRQLFSQTSLEKLPQDYRFNICIKVLYPRLLCTLHFKVSAWLQWQDCGRGLECYQVKSNTDNL